MSPNDLCSVSGKMKYIIQSLIKEKNGLKREERLKIIITSIQIVEAPRCKLINAHSYDLRCSNFIPVNSTRNCRQTIRKYGLSDRFCVTIDSSILVQILGFGWLHLIDSFVHQTHALKPFFKVSKMCQKNHKHSWCSWCSGLLSQQSVDPFLFWLKLMISQKKLYTTKT